MSAPSLTSGVVAIGTTPQPLVGPLDVEGDLLLLVENLSAVQVNFSLYEYPDGTTPILDGGNAASLNAVAPNSSVWVQLPKPRAPTVSVSAQAASGSGNLVRATFIQPKLKRTRSRLGA